ncbi:hypothetical protein ACW95P_00885 [Candidatus Mycoplasma pogonae]
MLKNKKIFLIGFAAFSAFPLVLIPLFINKEDKIEQKNIKIKTQIEINEVLDHDFEKKRQLKKK